MVVDGDMKLKSWGVGGPPKELHIGSETVSPTQTEQPTKGPQLALLRQRLTEHTSLKRKVPQPKMEKEAQPW